MNFEFQAIYEHGVLRPLTPLDLDESTQVTVAVRESNGATEEKQELTPGELAQQQAALNAMFAEVESMPQTPRRDGLSNRDHDQILYGSP